MRLLAPALLIALAAPAAAETCASGPDRSAERAALFETLRDAPDERAGEEAASAIWRFWFVAPDAKAQTLLSAAQNAVGEGLPESALGALDELIAYCPTYAEAWNQRATLRFILRDYEGSLADVEKVLELEPLHFGALAGKAVMLIGMGRTDEGQEALRAAAEIHPWLRERRHIAPRPGIDL